MMIPGGTLCVPGSFINLFTIIYIWKIKNLKFLKCKNYINLPLKWLFNVLFQLSYKCLKEHYNWIYNMCFEWFHMEQYLCLVFIWIFRSIYYLNPFPICLSEFKVLIERCLYASYDASYELGAFGNILLTSQA